MQFTHLGRAAEIGANSYLLKTDKARVVLDCGMHPKEEGMDAVPDYRSFAGEVVDSIVLTHSHLDHAGTLPIVQREHPEAQVYMTAPTKALTDALLHNSTNVMSSKGMELGIKEYPLFGHKELERLSKKWLERDYKKPFYMDAEGTVKGTFYDAGHILGSAGVMIEAEDKKVFYTGDVQFEDQTLLKGADFPEEPVDTLIMETTRGLYERPADFTRKAEEDRFIQAMVDGLKGGGSVLIPIGGLSTKMSYIFDEFSESTRRTLPGFNIFEDMEIKTGSRKKREPITYQPGAIYALSSGMMSPKTVSNIFARSFIDNPGNHLLFVGYAEQTTPAFAIKSANTGDEVELEPGKDTVTLNCNVEVFDFSGHAPREHLLDMALKMQPKKTLLVHGDMPAMEWFRDQLKEKAPDMEVIIPEPGETHEI